MIFFLYQKIYIKNRGCSPKEEVQGNGTKRTTVDRMGESSSCSIFIVRARLSTCISFKYMRMSKEEELKLWRDDYTLFFGHMALAPLNIPWRDTKYVEQWAFITSQRNATTQRNLARLFPWQRQMVWNGFGYMLRDTFFLLFLSYSIICHFFFLVLFLQLPSQSSTIYLW